MMNGWDAPLSGDTGEFPLLPAGEYEYTVSDASGKEYTPRPGGRYGACKQIKLTLIVEGKDTKGKERSIKVFDNLFSDPQAEWRLNSFVKSAGIYTEGMTLGDVVRRAPGSVGRCTIRIHEYNGRKRNEVDRWIIPDPGEEPQDEVTNANDLPF